MPSHITGLCGIIAQALGSLKRISKRLKLRLIILGAIIATVAFIVLLLPQPEPFLKITYPVDASSVSQNEAVSGVSKNIPTGQQIWVIVYAHEANQFYPISSIDTQPNGNWSSIITIGEANDSGYSFDIIVALANQDAQNQINAYKIYAKNNYSTNDSYPGMSELPSGLVTYDRITVTRSK
jgi:hypothetical protein